MLFLTQACQNCHKPMRGGIYRFAHLCPHCHYSHRHLMSERHARRTHNPAAEVATRVFQAVSPAEYSPAQTPTQPAATPSPLATSGLSQSRPTASVTLSKEAASSQALVKTFGELSVSSVLSLPLKASHFTQGKFSGTRDESVQAALKQGKADALAKLKQRAEQLGANWVAEVAVKNELTLQGQTSATITVIATGIAALNDTSCPA